MRSGELAGLNLSYRRVELHHNIGEIKKTLQQQGSAMDSKIRQELEQQLKHLQRKHDMVVKAIEAKNEKDSLYV